MCTMNYSNTKKKKREMIDSIAKGEIQKHKYEK